jgi:hypothetical protein
LSDITTGYGFMRDQSIVRYYPLAMVYRRSVYCQILPWLWFIGDPSIVRYYLGYGFIGDESIVRYYLWLLFIGDQSIVRYYPDYGL